MRFNDATATEKRDIRAAAGNRKCALVIWCSEEVILSLAMQDALGIISTITRDADAFSRYIIVPSSTGDTPSSRDQEEAWKESLTALRDYSYANRKRRVSGQ